MAELIEPPDIQKVVINFLLDRDEVTAFFDGYDGVYSRWPKTKVWPAVRVTQFNDQLVTSYPRHLVRTFLTVEAVGGPNVTCRNLAAKCIAVLEADLPGAYDGALVTTAECSGLRDEPDTTFEPAINRWLFSAEVVAHNLAVVGS